MSSHNQRLAHFKADTSDLMSPPRRVREEDPGKMEAWSLIDREHRVGRGLQTSVKMMNLNN